jgi:ATP-dependent exoDNAse (exonuclease V) beta subunit
MWVLDYKSGESAAENHRAQMEEYRRAVAAAFPGRPVRCLLVYGAENIVETFPCAD